MDTTTETRRAAIRKAVWRTGVALIVVRGLNRWRQRLIETEHAPVPPPPAESRAVRSQLPPARECSKCGTSFRLDDQKFERHVRGCRDRRAEARARADEQREYFERTRGTFMDHERD